MKEFNFKLSAEQAALVDGIASAIEQEVGKRDDYRLICGKLALCVLQSSIEDVARTSERLVQKLHAQKIVEPIRDFARKAGHDALYGAHLRLYLEHAVRKKLLPEYDFFVASAYQRAERAAANA